MGREWIQDRKRETCSRGLADTLEKDARASDQNRERAAYIQ